MKIKKYSIFGIDQVLDNRVTDAADLGRGADDGDRLGSEDVLDGGIHSANFLLSKKKRCLKKNLRQA